MVKGNKVYKNPYGIEVGSEEWRSYYTDSNCVRNIKIKKILYMIINSAVFVSVAGRMMRKQESSVSVK